MKEAKEKDKRKNKYEGIYYNSPFATTLRKLLNQKEFNQEKIAKELNVARQTISLYANGNSLPDINKFEQIITFFKNNGYDYSSDYWLGFISEKSTDLNVKAINKQYGLNEKSLSSLKVLNDKKKSQGLNQIKTLNYILENCFVKNPNSLLAALTNYLFLAYSNETIQLNAREINEYGVNTLLEVEKRILIKEVLMNEIEHRLIEIKNEIKKEGEKCERKRKS